MPSSQNLFLSTKYYSGPDHRIDNYEDISERKRKFYEK